MKTDNRDYLGTIILDIFNDGNRKLAWKLIDHYFKKSTELYQFDILGNASLKTDKRETYLKCAEYAYSISKTPSELYAARGNLYKAYNMMNRPEDALFYIEQNLKIDPEDFDAQCQKITSLLLMNQKEKAEELVFGMLDKNPEKIDKLKSAIYGKYLREGNLSAGILTFVEGIKPKNNFFETKLQMKKWNGEIEPKSKLYVDVEGGIGDQIINIRFFDKIKSLGMEPILVSHDNDYYKDINSVFRRHGYNVTTDRIIIDKTQKWSPLMSLPGYLKLSESDLWNGPYLKPLRNEKNKLTSSNLKIGIKCSGNPYFGQDEYRKIPFEQMLSVLPKNAEVYYIDVEKKNKEGVIDLGDRINSWEDTLDFIDQMDCIVSSCTSLVHAAGAMGKTTFVAVPIAEYYIWTSSRTDGSTPWYGENFYVAKQTKLRDWSEPLRIIGEKLERYK